MENNSQPENKKNNINLEKMMEQLDKILKQLEDPNHPLDESVTLFETGMKVANQIQTELDRIKHRINEIIEVNQDHKA